MSLASQTAYIYELRNYPEYSALTKSIFKLLLEQWEEAEKPETIAILKTSIDDTLANL